MVKEKKLLARRRHFVVSFGIFLDGKKSSTENFLFFALVLKA